MVNYNILIYKKCNYILITCNETVIIILWYYKNDRVIIK